MISKRTIRMYLTPLSYKQLLLLGCDAARLTLSSWEQSFPLDQRPRLAIEKTELYLYGKVNKSELEDVTSQVSMTSLLTISPAASWASYAAWAAAYSALVEKDQSFRIIANELVAVQDPSNKYSIKQLFLQTKPTTPIPITPTLKAVATNIVQTRNFEEYYVLLDNLEEFHNIQLERTVPLGLSHYVLYTLTNTN